jgi:hypothetical protein
MSWKETVFATSMLRDMCRIREGNIFHHTLGNWDEWGGIIQCCFIHNITVDFETAASQNSMEYFNKYIIK